MTAVLTWVQFLVGLALSKLATDSWRGGAPWWQEWAFRFAAMACFVPIVFAAIEARKARKAPKEPRP